MIPDLIECEIQQPMQSLAPQPSWGARVNYSRTSASRIGDRPIEQARDRDSELMLRVREGDQGSFELLLKKHRGPMIHFLHRMVQNDAVAEELTQEVFLRVFKSRQSYRAQREIYDLVVPDCNAPGAQLDSRRAQREVANEFGQRNGGWRDQASAGPAKDSGTRVAVRG